MKFVYEDRQMKIDVLYGLWLYILIDLINLYAISPCKCKGNVMKKIICYAFFPLFFLLTTISTSHGEEPPDDLSPLNLTAFENAPATTSRSPKPLSRIAENVTVITAEQIKLLNAHTLTDVLQTIPGIQFDSSRTPGSWATFSINTLSFNHVLLFIDGISQNDAVNNFPDTGLMPAQQIERIEIIKGAASSAWGPAMGGVVNVITKSADPQKKFGGEASVSYGERGTSDLNGELSGVVDRFGYYLAGGNLYSRGLLPGNGINLNHVWGKFDYTLPNRGKLTVGGNLRDANRGLEESADMNWHDTDAFRYYHLFTDYSQPLAQNLSLDLSARHRNQWNRTILGSIVPDPNWPDLVTTIRQKTTSSSSRIRWDKAPFTSIAGFDYEHHEITTADGETVSMNRWAAYTNGSLAIGSLTLLPGIRYDHTALSKNPTTFTLGATLQLSEKTMLRGYTASGYGLSNTLLADSIQRIHTTQLGIESNRIPYLWVKGTGFYNKLSDIKDVTDPTIPPAKQTRQGFELEARTVPLAGLSLSGGYAFINSKDDATHEKVKGVESQSVKTALTYKNSNVGVSGTLTGNYVWWNGDSSYNPHYTPMIWNLHLSQKLNFSELTDTELFFSGNNLFNGSQYTNEFYKNAGRWVEGGVRFKF